MSTTQGGPGNIVTNGLILYLDAANPTSYPFPNTGSTWFDLSSNGDNGTLVNGVSYTGLNGGSFVFDGIDDSIFFPDNTFGYSPGVTGEVSLEIWVYPTGPFSSYNAPPATNLAGLLGQSYYNNSNGWGLGIITISGIGNCFEFQVRRVSTIVSAGASVSGGYATFNNGNWYHVVGSFTRDNFSRLYVNGELKASTSTTPLNGLTITPSLNDASIGQIRNRFYSGCRIASAKIYNRPLTSSEVLQNFNSSRARFGI
jgi:hypothetical protein